MKSWSAVLRNLDLNKFVFCSVALTLADERLIRCV